MTRSAPVRGSLLQDPPATIIQLVSRSTVPCREGSRQSTGGRHPESGQAFGFALADVRSAGRAPGSLVTVATASLISSVATVIGSR